MEPSHRIALVPVVDASNSNLPGDDAVNFFVLVNFVEEFGVLRLHDWLLLLRIEEEVRIRVAACCFHELLMYFFSMINILAENN